MATKKKTKKIVPSGIAKVQATFNNTIILLTDLEGGALAQGSPARVGFKGARRSTAFAATKAAMEVAERAIKKYGLKEILMSLTRFTMKALTWEGSHAEERK